MLNTEPSTPPGDASYIYIITGEAMVTDLTTQIKRVNAGEVFHGLVLYTPSRKKSIETLHIFCGIPSRSVPRF